MVHSSNGPVLPLNSAIINGCPHTKNLKKCIFLQGTKVDSKLPVCASTHFWSRSGGGINKWYRQFVVFQRFFLHITVLVGTYFIALPFADLPFPEKVLKINYFGTIVRGTEAGWAR